MLVPIPMPSCTCWGRSTSAVILGLHLQPSPSFWAAGGPRGLGGTAGEVPHLSLQIGYISIYICVDVGVVLRLKMVSVLPRSFSHPSSIEEKSLEIWAVKELLLFWQSGACWR